MARKSNNRSQKTGIDINDLSSKLRNRSWEQRHSWQKECLSIIVNAPKKYDVELRRTDRAHLARLSSCEMDLLRVIRLVSEAYDPPVFSEWDIRIAQKGLRPAFTCGTKFSEQKWNFCSTFTMR